ncbi:Aste57867_22708 [Aphanomyces stellatus]|uniref:Aste57867_22708 protein n=1 Tax=Aphanomyces stellatus TaxID=120398 RepID=A0A485LKP0_9STRA|nr:hypothetical protein As57867_022638 [Aphanomyces stellatus]VFT99362.1 Aste57867_22708 [Aphanomyces stellatus]
MARLADDIARATHMAGHTLRAITHTGSPVPIAPPNDIDMTIVADLTTLVLHHKLTPTELVRLLRRESQSWAYITHVASRINHLRHTLPAFSAWSATWPLPTVTSAPLLKTAAGSTYPSHHTTW